MSQPTALVRNAADPEQVREAGKTQQTKRQGELEDLRAVLATPHGRRLLWRLLSHCGAFESVWHPSALIHYNAGKQDVGHFLIGEITEAQPQALVEMIQA